MSRGKELRIDVNWHTNKVFVGDICYALDDDLYQGVWGDKLGFKDGEVENYALVASTEYGDGCYDSRSGTVYGVDAGVIGVTDIEHFKDKENSVEDLERLGAVVDVPSGHAEIHFISDADGTFYITINDGTSGDTLFSDVIWTGSDEEDEDEDDWDDEEDDDWN